jgi:ATP synthase F1 gamma subunit
MQLVRKQFETNARFFAGIREVYGIVKAHGRDLPDAGRGEVLQRTRNRDIYIALTSNKRFYGTLNRDIMRSLVRVMGTASGSDFLVVGQTGAQYLESTGFHGTITRMEFVDDTPDPYEMQNILSLIDTYNRVFVVYPKFVNTFRQDIAMTDITQTPESTVESEMRADYIFEPEIPKMLAFFEAQVRRALFERVMIETELARAAARAMKMRDAKDRAGGLRGQYERSLRRELATLADLELMETFIGFNFWKR